MLNIENCLYKIAYRNEYDMLANEIAKEIFLNIKQNRTIDFLINKQNFVIKVQVQNTGKESSYDAFDIKADMLDFPHGVNKRPEMIINIFLDNDFVSGDYQNFNYVLYEVIRHELEHYYKYSLGTYPDDDYKKLYSELINLKNKNLEEHIKLVSEYILSETEIDSYVKSIMYVAKKQHKPVTDIIEQVIKRAFFNNDPELARKSVGNKTIIDMLNYTRKKLIGKLKEFYPRFREVWI